MHAAATRTWGGEAEHLLRARRLSQLEKIFGDGLLFCQISDPTPLL
jgi:hypothetical protein